MSNVRKIKCIRENESREWTLDLSKWQVPDGTSEKTEFPSRCVWALLKRRDFQKGWPWWDTLRQPEDIGVLRSENCLKVREPTS